MLEVHGFIPVWVSYAKALGLPMVVARPALYIARRNVLGDLWGQGTGRHDLETVRRFGKQLITSFADLVAEGPYVMGERPTTYDATAYAFAAVSIHPEFTCPVREHARNQTNLRAYCDWMRERYFD